MSDRKPEIKSSNCTYHINIFYNNYKNYKYKYKYNNIIYIIHIVSKHTTTQYIHYIIIRFIYRSAKALDTLLTIFNIKSIKIIIIRSKHSYLGIITFSSRDQFTINFYHNIIFLLLEYKIHIKQVSTSKTL